MERMEDRLGEELFSELMGAIRLHTHDHEMSLQIVQELAPILARHGIGASVGAETMTAMVDRAMVEMQNMHPPLRRSECERLIKAAFTVGSIAWRETETGPSLPRPPRR